MHPLSPPPADDDGGDHLVWDVPDPFAPPDPTEARLRALLQAEIARMRRHESVGPLERLPDSDSDSDSDPDAPSSAGDSDSEHGPEHPADDADADDEQDDDEDEDEGTWPHRIVLPRLLHTRPLCFLPPPSPPPSPASSSDEAPSPALAYTDTAEAEERARKARRDAHRSRLKALAILGPEAASALSPTHTGPVPARL